MLLSPIGSMSRSIYSCIQLPFLGTHLFPIHSCELDNAKIMCQVYLLRSISENVYFWSGSRHDQTCWSTIGLFVHYYLCSDFQLCLFNIVITTAPQWRLQIISTYGMDLQPNMNIYLVRWSSLPLSLYLASPLRQSPTGGFWCIVYIFYEVVIFAFCKALSRIIASLYLCCFFFVVTTTNELLLTEYIFCNVIIITGRHHDLLTTVDLCISLVRWSSSPVIVMTCLASIYYYDTCTPGRMSGAVYFW